MKVSIKSWFKSWVQSLLKLSLLLKITGSATILGLLLFSGMALYYIPQLPRVETLRDMELQIPLKIYANGGELIGEFGKKRRTPIDFSEIPPDFIQALIAAEDDGFFDHFGISIMSLLRAVYEWVTTGSKQSGGSTITMQVARNFFLTREQTFLRKFNEILLALKIEREITKNEILELYVNKIYCGKRAYGIQAAANVYYGKHLKELNLAQLTMIAGLPKAPSDYNPVVNPERAKSRRNWILKRMLALNYIDNDTYLNTKAQPITARDHGSILEYDAIFATELVRQKLKKIYGDDIYEKGYQVYTSIDLELQKSADQAVLNGILTYDRRHGYRGAELNLATPVQGDQMLEALFGSEEPEATSETSTVAISDLSSFPDSWYQELLKLKVVGGLEPAVVIEVADTMARVILKTKEIVTIGWRQGINDAAPFINSSQRGPRPQKATDILSVGDVIRVRSIEGQWYLSQLPKVQAALVALQPNNGAIKAITGGFDFYSSNFNRATQALRQPGSNLKPMLYAVAFESGLTPATIINDAPIVFKDTLLEENWRPTNDSKKFYGPTPLRKALYLSRNMVSIRILQRLGIPKARKGLKRFGFDNNDLPKNLTLSLGSQAVTPIKMATAYSVLANGGYKITPFIIERVTDRNDKVLFKNTPETVCNPCSEALPANPKAKQILDPRVVFIIDSILKDVIKKGTGRGALQLKRGDIAGKTGTTNGPKDAWFSGYNPDIIATAWLGFDDNQLLGQRESGGKAALPIWRDFMKTALTGKKEQYHPLPDGLIRVKVDKDSGQRALPGSTNVVFEYFLQENVPPEISSANKASEADQQKQLTEDIF